MSRLMRLLLQGELCIVLRGPTKGLSKSEAESAILGYTIGNDLTARLFQDPKRTGGQYTYAKAFDAFAPIGPRLVHPSKFKAAPPTTISTRLNGKVVQHSELDFIFPVNELISYLSQGMHITKSEEVAEDLSLLTWIKGRRFLMDLSS